MMPVSNQNTPEIRINRLSRLNVDEENNREEDDSASHDELREALAFLEPATGAFKAINLVGFGGTGKSEILTDIQHIATNTDPASVIFRLNFTKNHLTESTERQECFNLAQCFRQAVAAATVGQETPNSRLNALYKAATDYLNRWYLLQSPQSAGTNIAILVTSLLAIAVVVLQLATDFVSNVVGWEPPLWVTLPVALLALLAVTIDKGKDWYQKRSSKKTLRKQIGIDAKNSCLLDDFAEHPGERQTADEPNGERFLFNNPAILTRVLTRLLNRACTLALKGIKSTRDVRRIVFLVDLQDVPNHLQTRKEIREAIIPALNDELWQWVQQETSISMHLAVAHRLRDHYDLRPKHLTTAEGADDVLKDSVFRHEIHAPDFTDDEMTELCHSIPIPEGMRMDGRNTLHQLISGMRVGGNETAIALTSRKPVIVSQRIRATMALMHELNKTDYENLHESMQEELRFKFLEAFQTGFVERLFPTTSASGEDRKALIILAGLPFFDSPLVYSSPLFSPWKNLLEDSHDEELTKRLFSSRIEDDIELFTRNCDDPFAKKVFSLVDAELGSGLLLADRPDVYSALFINCLKDFQRYRPVLDYLLVLFGHSLVPDWKRQLLLDDIRESRSISLEKKISSREGGEDLQALLKRIMQTETDNAKIAEESLQKLTGLIRLYRSSAATKNELGERPEIPEISGLRLAWDNRKNFRGEERIQYGLNNLNQYREDFLQRIFSRSSSARIANVSLLDDVAVRFKFIRSNASSLFSPDTSYDESYKSRLAEHLDALNDDLERWRRSEDTPGEMRLLLFLEHLRHQWEMRRVGPVSGLCEVRWTKKIDWAASAYEPPSTQKQWARCIKLLSELYTLSEDALFEPASELLRRTGLTQFALPEEALLELSHCAELSQALAIHRFLDLHGTDSRPWPSPEKLSILRSTIIRLPTRISLLFSHLPAVLSFLIAIEHSKRNHSADALYSVAFDETVLVAADTGDNRSLYMMSRALQSLRTMPVEKLEGDLIDFLTSVLDFLAQRSLSKAADDDSNSCTKEVAPVPNDPEFVRNYVLAVQNTTGSSDFFSRFNALGSQLRARLLARLKLYCLRYSFDAAGNVVRKNDAALWARLVVESLQANRTSRLDAQDLSNRFGHLLQSASEDKVHPAIRFVAGIGDYLHQSGALSPGDLIGVNLAKTDSENRSTCCLWDGFESSVALDSTPVVLDRFDSLTGESVRDDGLPEFLSPDVRRQIKKFNIEDNPDDDVGPKIEADLEQDGLLRMLASIRAIDKQGLIASGKGAPFVSTLLDTLIGWKAWVGSRGWRELDHAAKLLSGGSNTKVHLLLDSTTATYFKNDAMQSLLVRCAGLYNVAFENRWSPKDFQFALDDLTSDQSLSPRCDSLEDLVEALDIERYLRSAERWPGVIRYIGRDQLQTPIIVADNFGTDLRKQRTFGSLLQKRFSESFRLVRRGRLRTAGESLDEGARQRLGDCLHALNAPEHFRSKVGAILAKGRQNLSVFYLIDHSNSELGQSTSFAGFVVEWMPCLAYNQQDFTSTQITGFLEKDERKLHLPNHVITRLLEPDPKQAGISELVCRPGPDDQVIKLAVTTEDERVASFDARFITETECDDGLLFTLSRA